MKVRCQLTTKCLFYGKRPACRPGLDMAPRTSYPRTDWISLRSEPLLVQASSSSSSSSIVSRIGSMALNLLTALVSAITGPTAAAHAGEVAEAARPRTDDCSTTDNDDKLTGKTDVHLCAPNPIVQTNSALVIPCTEAVTWFATTHCRGAGRKVLSS